MTENMTPSSPTPPSLPAAPPPGRAPAQRKRGSALWKILFGVAVLLLLGSGLVNLCLLAVVVSIPAPNAFERHLLEAGKKGQIVAVYDVRGLLDSSQAAQFSAFFSEIATDPKIKALVLRVTSPGGGVAASDQIHELVRRLRDDHGKTVVVSMGAVAASGGYYISAPADEIYAETTTITGSIGVLANWVVVQGTLEKIGAEAVVMRSTNARGWKDGISPFHKPDARQRAHLQEILDQMQARFEQVVKDGRGNRLVTKRVTYDLEIGDGDEKRTIRQTEIEPLNGKVYLGDAARQVGLVDAIGTQVDAIERAKVLAGVPRATVVQFARRKGLFAQLLTSQEQTTDVTRLGVELLDELQTPRIQMIWKVE